jgi:regulator of protease activity HflC (stomatin/prohibitin superfamily)
VLRLGQFQSIRGPGLFFVVPIIDRVRMVDTRVLAADIPRQEAITKDNVPVSINGALFFKVTSAEDAVMKIQDYVYGISLLAQTVLGSSLYSTSYQLANFEPAPRGQVREPSSERDKTSVEQATSVTLRPSAGGARFEKICRGSRPR